MSPAMVLITMWAFRLAAPTSRTFIQVTLVVIGGVITSLGATELNLTGLAYQIIAMSSHAVRLALTQSFLRSAELEMDSLTSLYYFAPVATVIVGVTAVILEGPKLAIADIHTIGLFQLLLNALLAFAVNVATFLLVGNHLGVETNTNYASRSTLLRHSRSACAAS